VPYFSVPLDDFIESDFWSPSKYSILYSFAVLASGSGRSYSPLFVREILPEFRAQRLEDILIV